MHIVRFGTEKIYIRRKENKGEAGVGILTCLKTIQFCMIDGTESKGTIYALVWEMSLRQTLKRIQTGNIGVCHGSK